MRTINVVFEACRLCRFVRAAMLAAIIPFSFYAFNLCNSAQAQQTTYPTTVIIQCPAGSGIHYLYRLETEINLVAARCETGNPAQHSLLDSRWEPLLTQASKRNLEIAVEIIGSLVASAGRTRN